MQNNSHYFSELSSSSIQVNASERPYIIIEDDEEEEAPVIGNARLVTNSGSPNKYVSTLDNLNYISY